MSRPSSVKRRRSRTISLLSLPRAQWEIEGLFGYLQDIEWAYEKSELFLLSEQKGEGTERLSGDKEPAMKTFSEEFCCADAVLRVDVIGDEAPSHVLDYMTFMNYLSGRGGPSDRESGSPDRT